MRAAGASMRNELTTALGAMMKSSLDAFAASMNQNLDTRFQQVAERMQAQDARITEVAAEKKSRGSA